MSSSSVINSLLYPDISDILERPKDKYLTHFTHKVKIHTVDKDLDATDSIALMGLTIIRDYVDSVADYIEVSIMIPLGTYVYDVYPYLTNIEVSVIVDKQLWQGKKPFTVTERFKAVFLQDKNSSLPTDKNHNKHDLNQQLPVTITLQLIDRTAEVLRVKTTKGNFDKVINSNTDMHIKPFIKSLISQQANNILIEGKPCLDRIEIEEPDNKEELGAITFPSFTRVVEVPEIIQNKNIGIYNAGVGNYIQRYFPKRFEHHKTFFVYSLYDPKTKYDNSPIKIIFFAPITSSHSITDITYRYEDQVLRILPSNFTKIDSVKESNVMSYGSGFRTTNSHSYMKKPVVMDYKKGPIYKKDQLATEVVYKERDDNINFARQGGVTSNHFAATSDILKAQGSYITIEVTNMDHDLIYPGAACKINYESDNGIIEVYGIIHRCKILYTVNNFNIANLAGVADNRLVSKMVLQIFI